MELRDCLLYFSLKYEGSWQNIYDAIKNMEMVDKDKYKELLDNLKSHYITIVDKEYPSLLRTINKPPYVIYYYGDLSLLDINNPLAVVGSRDASSYALDETYRLLKGLREEEVVIVSGLARGIDSIAHQSAIENDIKTIAVLGTGIDECYPKENFSLYKEIKENGLIISEYPNRVKVDKKSFSFRNRILIGISKFVFAPDVHDKSGTLVSIKYALSQGKDVFTIPHPLTSKNIANVLIQDGAKLIISSNDIIEEFK